jgi:hypothetical protein
MWRRDGDQGNFNCVAPSLSEFLRPQKHGEQMPNLAAYTEMMIDIHRQEVISLRRRLVLTANDRPDVKRRIADAEQWVRRWVELPKHLRD